MYSIGINRVAIEFRAARLIRVSAVGEQRVVITEDGIRANGRSSSANVDDANVRNVHTVVDTRYGGNGIGRNRTSKVAGSSERHGKVERLGLHVEATKALRSAESQVDVVSAGGCRKHVRFATDLNGRTDGPSARIDGDDTVAGRRCGGTWKHGPQLARERIVDHCICRHRKDAVNAERKRAGHTAAGSGGGYGDRGPAKLLHERSVDGGLEACAAH